MGWFLQQMTWKHSPPLPRAACRAQDVFSCQSFVSVRRWSERRVHTLSDAQLALSGGHDSEAEAWRSCVCQQHGHPDPNAPWYAALGKKEQKIYILLSHLEYDSVCEFIASVSENSILKVFIKTLHKAKCYKLYVTSQLFLTTIQIQALVLHDWLIIINFWMTIKLIIDLYLVSTLTNCKYMKWN